MSHFARGPDGFTDNQRRFLRARQHTFSDNEALRIVGTTMQALACWKKEEKFMALYREAVRKTHEVVEKVEPEQPMVMDSNRLPEVAKEQLELFGARLPTVFQRLFDIVEYGSDTNALKAIDIVGKWFGITPERFTPNKLTLIQQNIQSWSQPAVVIAAEEDDEQPDDNDSEAPIEASFSEVPVV